MLDTVSLESLLRDHVNPSEASKMQTSTSCVSLRCGAIAGGLKKQLMDFFKTCVKMCRILITILVMCCWCCPAQSTALCGSGAVCFVLTELAVC